MRTTPPPPGRAPVRERNLTGRARCGAAVRPKPSHRKISSGQPSAPSSRYRLEMSDGIYVIKILGSEIALQPCQCLHYKLDSIGITKEVVSAWTGTSVRVELERLQLFGLNLLTCFGWRSVLVLHWSSSPSYPEFAFGMCL